MDIDSTLCNILRRIRLAVKGMESCNNSFESRGILGVNFEKYITGIDHWIAFVLLGFLGGKMIYESLKGDDDVCDRFDLNELFMLAIATSIDALAVGITFAFLSVDLLLSVSLIGIVTSLR